MTTREFYEVIFGERGAKQVEESFDNVANSARETEQALGGSLLQANLLSDVIGQVVQAGLDLLQTIPAVGIEFQQLEKSLERQLGSAEAAKQQFQEIRDFAGGLPLQVNEVTQAFIRLSGTGITPTLEELERFGDLASTNPDASFGQFIEAVVDAQTGQFERLLEFGIRAERNGERVAFTFQNQRIEVENTAQAVKDAILEFANFDSVQGALADRAQTLEGRISNLGDVTDRLKANLFDIADVDLQNGIARLIGIFDGLADAAGRFAQRTNEADLALERLSGDEGGLQELSLEQQQRLRITQGRLDRTNVQFVDRLLRSSPVTRGGLFVLDSLLGSNISPDRRRLRNEAVEEAFPARIEEIFAGLRNGTPLVNDDFLFFSEQIDRFAGREDRESLLSQLLKLQERALEIAAQQTDEEEDQNDERRDAIALEEERLRIAQAQERAEEAIAEFKQDALVAEREAARLAEQISLNLLNRQLEGIDEAAEASQAISNERLEGLRARRARVENRRTNRGLLTGIDQQIEQEIEAEQERQAEFAQEREAQEERIAATRLAAEQASLDNQRRLNELALDRQEIELDILEAQGADVDRARRGLRGARENLNRTAGLQQLLSQLENGIEIAPDKIDALSDSFSTDIGTLSVQGEETQAILRESQTAQKALVTSVDSIARGLPAVLAALRSAPQQVATTSRPRVRDSIQTGRKK